MAVPAWELDDFDAVDELLASIGVTAAERDWRRRAACRGHDTAAFFPLRGEPIDDARAMCRACPVRVECLEYALDESGDPLGVWGGTSQRQRRAARRHGWSAAELIAKLDARQYSEAEK